jgi:hypothetical protein
MQKAATRFRVAAFVFFRKENKSDPYLAFRPACRIISFVCCCLRAVMRGQTLQRLSPYLLFFHATNGVNSR